MNSAEWLKQAVITLEKSNIGTARLDTLVLLEDCLETDRSILLAHPELKLKPKQLLLLNEEITRRSQHEPLAYIRGKSEFYGRDFIVKEWVLVPRPETELMIDQFKALHLARGSRVADVGAGTGCIGLTVAIENPSLKVDLYDISLNALYVAEHNAKNFGVKANFYQTDIMGDKHPNYRVVMANLPYVPLGSTLNPEAYEEPREAIFGGSDGLNVYRRLFQHLATLDPKPEFVLTESMPPQHETLASIATEAGYHILNDSDFIQCFERN